MNQSRDKERLACIPVPVKAACVNTHCILPYGITSDHIRRAMQDFLDFLRLINQRLHSKSIARLETFLMPANFSSIVGEFMNISLPKYCITLVRNQYHNGHPDLIPKGIYPNNAAQHATEGIEVKGSRYASGWQGHNPESIWLMVFQFDSNTSEDKARGAEPKPFVFEGVYCAKLGKDDWTFSGRSATSRRTITASVNRRGVEKMKANWVYDISPERSSTASLW